MSSMAAGGDIHSLLPSTARGTLTIPRVAQSYLVAVSPFLVGNSSDGAGLASSSLSPFTSLVAVLTMKSTFHNYLFVLIFHWTSLAKPTSTVFAIYEHRREALNTL